ncbi:hypothetical protein PHISCL_10343, partial [Aspergillus sclerotialis]
MHPVVYSPPPETLYVQFYDPWARDCFSPTQMKLATATPGTSEMNHLLDLITYSPNENQILEPKPYRYRLPPGQMEWIILDWEIPKVDSKTGECTSAVEDAQYEIEVEFDDDDSDDDEVVLRPVRISRFTELFDDDEEEEEDEDSWSPPPAGDFSFLDADRFAVESDYEEEEDEEEDGRFRIDVDDVLDSAVKIVGKA